MINPDRIVPTTCPYCGVGCNLELHIKNDTIYKVTSPFDGVVNQGNLCVKGRFGYDFIYSKDRVTVPLIRKTAQAPGARTQAFDRSEWRQISWDEALDYTADRLVEIYNRDGADAMAVYCCAKATNEDNYLLQKLFRALFRTNNVDHCTRLCHAGSVVALQMAIGSSAMSNTAAEVIHSDVFLVTGSNTAETHPIIALQMKAAVANHRAKLIVVDPRRVEMVNWAALWLPEKPGTDVPLFSAMAHVIIKERLYNEEFIRQRTEGFEEFSRSMEKFTPEYAEAISGVDRYMIVQAARMYATAKNAAIYWALGIPEHSHGTDNAMALIHLALLTGHIGRRGTGLNPLRGQNNVQGASDCGAMPWHYPGYQRVQDLFINESGAYADVFLPAASWAEKEGTFTNTDRRVQRVRKALEPRGESRPDWKIVCRLAERIEKRLGRPQSAFWAYQGSAEVLEEMGRVVPEYAGVKYRRIENQGLQTPVWDDSHPGTPYLFTESFPSGKGKFHPLEYVPAVEMPDEEYPFILTTGRLLEHWHGGTLTRHSKLDDLYPEARIEMNPADASRLKIEDGQAVRVSSRRGSIVLRAWVTQRTTVGVVFIPMHFAEAAANLLTIDALDPRAKIPEYKACAVSIVPANKEELARPEAKVERGRY